MMLSGARSRSDNKQTQVMVIGSFTRPLLPNDLSSFLNAGVLIDRRNNTPMEMDGYSLYLALKALELLHNVDYRSEREILVDAVISRMQACDGFWSHGAWTGSAKEVHMRFTAAAIRLLAEALADGLIDNPGIVLDALKRHLSFAENLTHGTWFLHDSLERPEEGLPNPHGVAGRASNHAWGSSATNCLVLNTHIDTVATCIYLLKELQLSGLDREYLLSKIDAGMVALKCVLTPNRKVLWRSFARLDSLVRSYIFRNYSKRSLPARALRKASTAFYFLGRQRVRSWLPTFVYPDGYTERDISLNGISFKYHVVNVYDLARLIIQINGLGNVVDEELRRRCELMIDDGIDYAIRSDYWRYLTTTMEDGIANLLCEAILARLGTRVDSRPPQHWIRAYCFIRRSLPPSPALLGYDPFIIKASQERGKSRDGWDTIRLRNGVRLAIDLANETALIDREPVNPSIPAT
jgi:hypothetical protein